MVKANVFSLPFAERGKGPICGRARNEDQSRIGERGMVPLCRRGIGALLESRQGSLPSNYGAVRLLSEISSDSRNEGGMKKIFGMSRFLAEVIYEATRPWSRKKLPTPLISLSYRKPCFDQSCKPASVIAVRRRVSGELYRFVSQFWVGNVGGRQKLRGVRDTGELLGGSRRDGRVPPGGSTS